MRIRHFISTVLIVIAAALVLCACQGGNTPDSSTPTKNVYVVLASYTKNAVVDGKLLADSADSVALIKFGNELKPENVEILKVNFDITNLVGSPAEIEVTDGTVSSAMSLFESVGDVSSNFVQNGNKYDVGSKTVELSDALLKDGGKYCLVLDGYTFKSGNITGEYGIGRRSDDTVTLFDVDGDGKYDFSRSNVVYNALCVVEATNDTLVLNGGFGTASAQEFFKQGSKVALGYKKGLSAKLPTVGSYLNASIRVDGTGEANYNGVCVMLEDIKTAKTVSAPLQASIYNSETDIMSRAGGRVMYWNDAISANEGASFEDSGRASVKNALGATFEFVLDNSGYIAKAASISDSEVDYSALPGYTTFETSTGTEGCALLDVQGGWHRSRTTYAQTQTEIQMLKNLGIRKVFIVTSNPGYPMFSYANVGYSTRTSFPTTVANFKRLGYEMPDYAYPDICHDMGMEVIAVYKPYEGGGISTAPEGAKLEDGKVGFESHFGITYSLETFLVDSLLSGKDYRICRRPDGVNDNLDGVVDRITVDFVSGSYAIRANTSPNRAELVTTSALSQTAIAGIVDGVKHSNKNPHRTHALNIWVSDNNFSYSLYSGNFDYEYVRTKKVLSDTNGILLNEGRETDCITLEITGLSIPQKYCAVTFVNTENLRTNPLGYTHIYSGDREIICTTTDFCHAAPNALYDNDIDDYVWGREPRGGPSSSATGIQVVNGQIKVTPTDASNEDKLADCEAISKFNLYGFEFNYEPYPTAVRGGNSFIAIGRGRIETFPGGYCEGYKEVRDYWVSHVEDLCKAGYDAVLIRPQSHSSIATDLINYGFNEPIIEKYKELYGAEAYNTLMDPSHAVTEEEYVRIMRIRGDYFALFYEEAAEVCHKYGTQIGVCLRGAYEDPIVDQSRNEATWWTMPKIVLDWKKMVDISDFILVKDYLKSAIGVMNNALATREYAKSQGKKVYIDLYDDQAAAFTSAIFSTASKDENTDGIVFYELSNVVRYTTGAFKALLDRTGFETVFKGEGK